MRVPARCGARRAERRAHRRLGAADAARNLAFNSIRPAWELAFVGYYVQALALGRLGLDAVLVLNYTLRHKADADLAKAIDLAGGELAQDLFVGEPALDAKLRGMRTDFHQFAHQTQTSVHLPIRDDGTGRRALHAGLMEDASLFRDVGYRLLNVSTMAVGALIKWRGGRDERWMTHAVLVSAQALDWAQRHTALVRGNPPAPDAGKTGAT